MTYIFKGFILATGQAFCFNVLLPLWYIVIKFKDGDLFDS